MIFDEKFMLNSNVKFFVTFTGVGESSSVDKQVEKQFISVANELQHQVEKINTLLPKKKKRKKMLCC